MYKLKVLAGLMTCTLASALPMVASAQSFTSPVMNPGTRQTSTVRTAEPIPKGTNVGKGWVTTAGSTAGSQPMPSGGGRSAGVSPGGPAAGWGGGGRGGGGMGGGGGCGLEACFEDGPGD